MEIKFGQANEYSMQCHVNDSIMECTNYYCHGYRVQALDISCLDVSSYRRRERKLIWGRGVEYTWVG